MSARFDVHELQEQEFVINMGPQHPSTHGVLRVLLHLDGENIRQATPYIGYLHRGTEKLAEVHKYYQNVPHTDRMDYLAAPSNNLGYVQAVEKLLGIEDAIPERAMYMRVIMAELARIASHLVWLGTHALDIGALSMVLYCFRERELILDLFERYCGARRCRARACRARRGGWRSARAPP
jgi:NADH:ubiquinone oxidoreductase subunit D